MVESDAFVLCGEWDTGPEASTEENYNIELPITSIVRHPGMINQYHVQIVLSRKNSSTITVRGFWMKLE